MINKRLPYFMFILIFMSLLFLVSCNSTKTYQVTFDTQSEIVIAPIIALEGEAIFAPNQPNREGYRFDGWMYNGEIFSFGVMPNKDIELIAQWSQYYQIHFETNGGTEVQSISIAEGDEIIITEIPKKSHYKFNGWEYLDAPLNITQMPSSNMNLSASWISASTITFSVIVYDRYLDEDVEIFVEELVEVEGASITPPANPAYPEYKFLSWELDGIPYEFDTMPNEDIVLTAQWLQLSNLPALFIDLSEQDGSTIAIEQITRETYVNSVISLENTDESYVINNAQAEFKGRGNGSWVDSGDKKGYRIKFESKQSVLGSPTSRHWVILANANFDDVTMFRNKLAFDMSNEIFTNIDYATSAEWVDVYFNGEYHGVYLLCEHLRVDEDRVNIDTVYGVLDTGYLIEYDAYASGTAGVDYFRVNGLRHPFTMKSPSPKDYLDEGLTLEEYKAHVSYIQEMVANMASAALSKDFEQFEMYADVNSFVDMYILHELFKNIDTGYSSFFIYRNEGTKLFAGPPWDFDATLGSTPSRGNGGPTGIYVGLSVQAFSSRTANEILISLYATPAFKEVIVDRWKNISSDIQSYVNQTLTNEMIDEYRFAIGRNFVRWPSPQGYGPVTSQETAEENWISNIEKLKQWLTDRVSWLNGEWD
jgi:hypothetical protein